MTAMRKWNLEWLNENANRAYPFTAASSRQDVSGTIKLPDSFIVAFVLPIHAGLDVHPEQFYLSSLGIFPTGYTLTFSYELDGDSVTVAAVSIARSTHTENREYAVAGIDEFSDTVGRVAIGLLKEIDKLPPGVYSFDRDSGNLEVDAIRPILRGVSSISVVNGSDRSSKLYGDVELVAGQNMRITVVQVDGQNPQVVFSAIEGEGLNEECICDEEVTGPCIRFINGIPPLPNGNFRMYGDECLQLEPINNGLKLNDVCSAPCCGCEELNSLVNQIHRFADGAITLQNFVARLESEVVNMAAVVLGSRLADSAGGCIEC